MTNRSQQTFIERLSTGNPRYRLLNGGSFSASEHFSPGASETKEVYVENTSSDIYLASFFAEVRSDRGKLFQTGYNVTEDTQGEDANIVPRRTDIDASDSIVAARTGGDGETGVYSAGTLSAKRVGGAGGGAAQVTPAQLTDSGTNVITPGDNILIRVEDFSGNASELSIEAVWVEIPEEDMPL